MNFPNFKFNKQTLPLNMAVRVAFKSMPRIFTGNDLLKETRKYLERPEMHDGTILRVLRAERQRNKLNVNFKCIEHRTSTYEKI